MDKTNHFYLRYLNERDENIHPCGVVALGRDGEDVVVSASFCLPEDQWNTRTGRDRAYGKLYSQSKNLRVDYRTAMALDITEVLSELGIPWDVRYPSNASSDSLLRSLDTVYKDQVEDLFRIYEQEQAKYG